MATESNSPAPAVVAVVVTCDPGAWFPEALASLANQDYPNLSVLVVDAGSHEDPTPQVAEVMPGAFVRRLDRRAGFAAAANEVLQIVEGASHYLFCHDDVALDSDAVHLMVEEAFRSNAGVAAPKYVQWQAPDHLLAVGATTDKVGARRSLVDPGELDQEQHDAVREVLVAPGGAVLVRADLFSALGGFDEAVASEGEDTDLSWRARLYGARVMVVPAARVRHLEAARTGQRPGSPDLRRRERNRYRLLLTCYRWYTLAWLLPLAAFWASAEAVVLVVQGRGGDAGLVFGSLVASVRQPGLLRSRRRVQHQRHVGDRAIRDLQARGNARLRSYVQARVEGVRAGLEHQGLTTRTGPLEVGGPEPDADGRAVAAPESVGPLSRGRHSLNGILLTLLLVVFVVGTRSLFGKGIPQIATLPNTSEGLASIWRSWWSAWQPGGLGVAAPSSPALALIGILGTVLFGAVGTLEHILVLAPLVIGPIGAYRASRFWGSPRAQMIAAVAYAVVPLPYNDLAGGHWDGLVAYAATPWVLSMLARLSSLAPVPASQTRRIWGRVVGLGLIIAVTAAVAPSYLYVVPLMGLALLVGSAVTTGPVSGVRAFGVSVAAAVVAFVVLLPWSATTVASRAALVGADPGPVGRLGLGQVLRFHTGPFGSGSWQWLLLLAAALPLFVGRDWRLAWAGRLWVVTLMFFALAWTSRRGWFPPLPTGVLLAPAAAALAASAALGMAAFELDLPGYNFGWRQAAAGLAGVCLALATIPWFAAAGSGRWDLPSADASSVLLLPSARSGDYRVLWVGAPAALPLAGRQLEQGFAYGTSYDGEPALADDWPTGPAGAAPVLARDLILVQRQLTTKLGHLLAPAGIRYIVVPNHVGPTGAGGRAVPVPNSLLAGLSLQTDLTVLTDDPDYTVFENAAWAPVRAVLPAQAAAAAAAHGVDGERLLQHTDLHQSTPVLPGGPATSSSGPVPAGATVAFGSTRSAGWHLSAGGRTIGSRPAFGWAMAFQVPPESGSTTRATLEYSTPTPVRVGYIGEMALWGLAVVGLIWERRRRVSADGYSEQTEPGWFIQTSSVPTRKRRPGRPAGRGPGRAAGPPRTEGDARPADAREAWSDA
ncbi:MAG: glycosyltransferase [Actinomycetota bacterium]|nr:glycosyltransferase [Actinomycetota bacterium]